MEDIITHLGGKVSTHSRLKAAGAEPLKLSLLFRSFNTQPPEGGWEVYCYPAGYMVLFQHTAA